MASELSFSFAVARIFSSIGVAVTSRSTRTWVARVTYVWPCLDTCHMVRLMDLLEEVRTCVARVTYVWVCMAGYLRFMFGHVSHALPKPSHALVARVA